MRPLLGRLNVLNGTSGWPSCRRTVPHNRAASFALRCRECFGEQVVLLDKSQDPGPSQARGPFGNDFRIKMTQFVRRLLIRSCIFFT
jgi:hypothetical protein